jgi:radical SAM superfamily enzyme YgiQ (UPF0313 family)
MVVRDVMQISRFTNAPVFILGDLLQQGEDYAYQVLRALQKASVKNQLIFELFNPAPREIMKEMALASPNFCLEISPESHDPAIRIPAGRRYSTEAFEQTIADALDAGCGRFDIYFMTGIPRQTPQSVMETVDYCDDLLTRFKSDKRLALFISPLSPFVDPGSLAFEQPKRYGYRILCHTVEEHRKAIVSPSWKYSLNYETEWMSRDQIAETAYESILRLNRVKAKHGIISEKIAQLSEQRLNAGRDMMHRLDEVMSGGNYEEELSRLKPEIDRINSFPVSEKIQQELPVGSVKLKYWRAAWSWLTGKW